MPHSSGPSASSSLYRSLLCHSRRRWTHHANGSETGESLRAATNAGRCPDVSSRRSSEVKTIGGTLLLAVTLVAGSSCARPDWIERTLVTVDVTGVWHGRSLHLNQSVYPELWLDVRQEGSKVKGSLKAQNMGNFGYPYSGPIEGSIAGDTFSFRQKDGRLSGEFIVGGDEMTGELTSSTGPSAHIVLRRIGPATSPDSPRQ